MVFSLQADHSIGYSIPLLDSDMSVAKKMFKMNVFGVVTVTQAFAPLLIASKGTIINIRSVLGKMPLPGKDTTMQVKLQLLSSPTKCALSSLLGSQSDPRQYRCN